MFFNINFLKYRVSLQMSRVVSLTDKNNCQFETIREVVFQFSRVTNTYQPMADIRAILAVLWEVFPELEHSIVYQSIVHSC